MDEIKELMELGVLIEPEAMEMLSSLSKESFKKVIKEAKEERPLMLSHEIIKRYLTKVEFKIIKTFSKQQKITITDLTNALNEKYNTLKDVLLKKIELQNIVSINKASSGDVTIIGLAKEIEEKEDRMIIEAEDPTGTIKCVILKELSARIFLDDVLAISGKVSNNILFATEVSFPDVPIRQAKYSEKDVTVAFVTDFNEKTDIDADFIFVLHCSSKDRACERHKNAQVFLLSEIGVPSIIEIGEVKIMFLVDCDPLVALKKRHINIEKTDFVIDTVPDIVFVNRKANANYKSITILGDNIKVNLKDREIKEINS